MANMSLYRIVTITDLALVRDVAGAATLEDIHFGNKAEFKTDTTTITYEGDGQVAKKYFSSAFDVDIAADTWDAEAFELTFGKATVTAGLPVGVTKRTYWGSNADAAGISCGVSATATVEDLATGANTQVRIVAPVGTLSPPNPPALANIAKSPMVAQFSAKKTTVDIAGDALPGVPADGCFWYMEELA
jgi:hypothetical protein